MRDKAKVKLNLNYPCPWSYKIIGRDVELIQELVRDVLGTADYSLTRSNSSSGGQYHCLNLELVVGSEIERASIYESLRQSPAIRMVL